jgi:hypothetical protein
MARSVELECSHKCVECAQKNTGRYGRISRGRSEATKNKRIKGKGKCSVILIA